jgi:enoyl-CoA hydratase/carnithine racemase
MPPPARTSYTRLRVVSDPGPDGVGRLTLARPAKSNAFDALTWHELDLAVRELSRAAAEGRVRAVLLDAEGPNFCAGLDLSLLEQSMAQLDGGGGDEGGSSSSSKHTNTTTTNTTDGAGRRERFHGSILAMQGAITSLERRLPVPVVAAISGACVGAGVDLITAADVRLCSDDSRFCVKEVDLGIAADLGSLQRLPSLVGLSCASEWALTARAVSSEEAERRGLVSRRCGDRQALALEARRVAELLARKPARALRLTKQALLHARDRPCVAEGLERIALVNMSALAGSDELKKAAGMAVAGGGGGGGRGGGGGAGGVNGAPRSRL